MRLYSLSLTNIGPFDEANLEFLAEGDTSAGVTFLTGRNGTGKTIVLDAIRATFGGAFVRVERDISQAGKRFSVRSRNSFNLLGFATGIQTRVLDGRGQHGMPDIDSDLSRLPVAVSDKGWQPPAWIVDYWNSQLALDGATITALGAIDHRKLYEGSLQGTITNASVTHLLCHFDYLRDSRNPRERATGEALYALAEKIIKFSVLDGALVNVERLTFTPIVRQGGHEVPLANISSGNAYLVQRMISLLGRMYSLHVLRESDPATIHQTPGLLLIDEAENHLHPSWQKRFIPGVREIFPNLQIIAATHSPFVLSSVPDARVYVCQYDPATRRTTVSEETAAYQNKAVDEILMSPAFDETAPFGPEVSDLLDARRDAIAQGDATRRKDIERQLVARNPTYFGYLDLDETLEAMRKVG